MTEFRMRNSRRRWGARLLLPIVAVWLAVMPYREARAILPLAVPIGVALIDAAGAVLMADATVAAGSAILGGVAMAAILLTPGDSPVENGQVRVPLSTAAGSIAAMSAIAPIASAIEPVIPAPYAAGDYDGVYCGPSSDGGATTGAQMLCNTCFSTYGEGSGVVCKVLSSGTAIPQGTLFDRNAATPAINPYVSCPNGYSLVSGGCNLSNPYAAVPDNKADYGRIGTTIAQKTGDDTPTKVKGVVSQTSYANDTVSAVGTDGDGNPRQVSVQALSNGGSLITTRTQRVDANGNSYVENKIVQVSAAGAVNAVSTTSTAQRLEYNAANGSMTVTAAPTSTFAPAVAGTGAASEPIVFPSDYARAGEAVGAANLVNLHLGAKLDALVAESPAPADLELPVASQFDDAYFNGTFTNLLGWQLPAHSGQCPTSSMVFYGSTLVLDAHCAIIDQFAGVLATVATALWTIMALLIVLGA